MLIGSAVVFAAMFAVTTYIKAAATDNVTGWLMGWSTDAAGNPSYIDFISMNNVTSGDTFSYGVNIPSGNGLLSGTAYDGGLGSYVAFDNSGGYLAAGTCPVADPTYGCGAGRLNNALKGWARVVSIAQAQAAGNSGGWDGWISLSGATYGVTITPATGQLGGFAWAGDQGWIDFSGAKITAACIPVAPPCSPSGDGKATGPCGEPYTGLPNCVAPVTCGSATTGGPYVVAPTTNLCSNGTTPAVTDSGTTWTWNCVGGTNNPCTAAKSTAANWKEVAP